MAAEPDAGRDPLRSRRRVLAIALIVGLAGAGVALAAASRIESPQQAAASAHAPSPSVITATIRRTVLAETITAQGTVTAGDTVAVTGGGTAPAGEKPVVTAMPLKVGEAVYPGQVLVQVCGRPLIALPGDLPAYRNLTLGDAGPDVLQLQRALTGLGYVISDAPGTFGGSTDAAVASLYAELGYNPPTIPVPTTPAAAPSGSPPRAGGSGQGGSGTAAHAAEVYVPMGEVWYVPSLPARVASIKAGVGSGASGTVLTLAKGGLMLTASLDPVNGPLVKPGMTASVWPQGDSSLQARAARVTAVSHAAVNSSSGIGYPVTLNGVASLPWSWAGQNVIVSIRVSSTGGPVLTVPQAAIYSTADGATHVLAYYGGREKVVPVSVGASVGGLVQVSAPPGVLRPGEDVVLGMAGP